MPIFSSTIQDHVANTMSQPYYRFDGVDDYILTSSVGANSTEVSVLINFRLETLQSGFATIIQVGDLLITKKETTHVIHINQSGQSGVDGTTALVADKWYHMVVTVDSSNTKLYLNGVLDATLASTVFTTGAVYFGKFSAGQFSNCQISDSKVYNNVLTATEVEELYSGASVPYKYKGANQTGLLLNSGNHSNVSFNSWSSTQENGSISSWNVTSVGMYCSTPITPLIPGKTYRIAFDLDGSMNDGMYFTVANDTNLGSAGGRHNLKTAGWTTGHHEFIFSVDDAYDNIGFFKGYGSTDNALPELTNWSFTSIGAVAEYDGSGIASNRWFDKSGNDFHGSVSGATVENAPSGDDGLVYEEGTWTPTAWYNGADGNGTEVTSPTAVYGRYTIVGRLISLSFYFYHQDGPNTGTQSQWIIKGLPFSVRTGGPYQFLTAGYTGIDDDNHYNDSTGTHRWQANGATTLYMYGKQYNTVNTTNAYIEFAGHGTLELA